MEATAPTSWVLLHRLLQSNTSEISDYCKSGGGCDESLEVVENPGNLGDNSRAEP
jgi:hypothetical protein